MPQRHKLSAMNRLVGHSNLAIPEVDELDAGRASRGFAMRLKFSALLDSSIQLPRVDGS